jgi:hypothetical protein
LSAFRNETIMNYALGHFAECTTFFPEVDDNADAAFKTTKI